MNGKQKEFLAKSGINLTDGLIYFSENEKVPFPFFRRTDIP